jgi:phosphoglycerate dehydrogenase-like enzyme
MVSMNRKAVFLAEKNNPALGKVFDERVMERLHEQVELYPEWINRDNIGLHENHLKQVEIAFSTWGMPLFTEDELRSYMPNLQILFYGAGSVQRFARPFLSRGCVVVSAWSANAVPVAEYTAAQIVLANKGFYQASSHYKQSSGKDRRAKNLYPGNYGARVGILGAGMIGQKVIELLKAFQLHVDVFDPFLSDARAAELGVHKSSLKEIFTHCDTISNHLANLPATVGMLNKEHFDRMLPHATFINTGRGAQVVEEDLIRALTEIPTRTGVLDVTYPEPVQPDSGLLKLENVILTPHIAGSMNREVARMGHTIADEFKRYCNGEALQYQVTLKMLETMA